MIAVAGVETLVFTLGPCFFLDGYHLFHWSPPVAAAVGLRLALGVVCDRQPAVSHYEGEAKASVAWLATLLLIQALVALGLWAFFVMRRRRPALADPSR